MTLHFESLATADAEFDTAPLAQPSAEPLSGEIITRTKVHYRIDSPAIASGVWECEPGLSRWTFTDRGEFIHVVAGQMTVTRDGEDPVLLTPGSTAVFELGWEGTWEVHETLRKVFVVFRPAPDSA
jgi:uncharacterized cupin superfamily protein